MSATSAVVKQTKRRRTKILHVRFLNCSTDNLCDLKKKKDFNQAPEYIMLSKLCVLINQLVCQFAPPQRVYTSTPVTINPINCCSQSSTYTHTNKRENSYILLTTKLKQQNCARSGYYVIGVMFVDVVVGLCAFLPPYAAHHQSAVASLKATIRQVLVRFL